MTTLNIRPATIADTPQILRFITDLAIYEEAEHEVEATVADLEHSLFGADSTAHALMCMQGDTPVGFCVYFFNYSTWQGRNGLYLEDLYVAPEHRGIGAGKALLKNLAQLALAKNCGRFEWNVLDWNEPAIKFYEAMGAKPKPEWIGYRLAGEALEAFANS